MNISRRFTDAYDYIKDDPDILEKCLIGGGLSFITFLILPLFAIQGYIVKILRQTQNPTNPKLTSLPEWEDGPQLLIDGLLATLFSLAITVAITLTALITIISYYTTNSPSLLYITLPTTLALTSLILYLTPAYFTLLVRDGFTNLPNISTLFAITFTLDYAVTLTALFVIQIPYSIGILLLHLITLGLAQPLIPFIAFPVNCAFTHILGTTVTKLNPHSNTSQNPPNTADPTEHPHINTEN